MARIELAPEVLGDFDRICDHLAKYESPNIGVRIAQIIQALDILAHSPRIGRPVAEGMRELAIGQDSRGYIALYRHVPDIDAVFVLAIRSQRELGD